MSDLKKIKDEYLSKLKRQLNLSEINEIKSNLFGKNGLIALSITDLVINLSTIIFIVFGSQRSIRILRLIYQKN